MFTADEIVHENFVFTKAVYMFNLVPKLIENKGFPTAIDCSVHAHFFRRKHRS